MPIFDPVIMTRVRAACDEENTQKSVATLWQRLTAACAIRDETANNSDDSPADGIQGDHADQQECQHHQVWLRSVLGQPR